MAKVFSFLALRPQAAVSASAACWAAPRPAIFNYVKKIVLIFNYHVKKIVLILIPRIAMIGTLYFVKCKLTFLLNKSINKK